MSNQPITIETINTVTHNDIPVLTTELLASFYQTEVKNIQQNYNRNKNKFIEGKHYFKLSGLELAALRPSLRGLQISSKARNLILWTERGAARHAKMLDTDQAWDVFEKLEDCYFDENKKQSLDETHHITLTDYELFILAYLYKASDNMRQKIEFIAPALHMMGAPIADSFISMSIEYKRCIEESKKILERETRHIQANHFTGRWNTVLNSIRNA